MTPEEELQRLIEAQRRDDTDHCDPEKIVAFSLNAGDEFEITNYIGVDEDGEIVNFMRPQRGSILGHSQQVGVHGTAYSYGDLGCRCAACTNAKRVAQADWVNRNREAYNAWRREYTRKRWATDPAYRERKRAEKRRRAERQKAAA